MTNPLPKWIQKRYAILWKRFKDKEFKDKILFKSFEIKEICYNKPWMVSWATCAIINHVKV